MDALTTQALLADTQRLRDKAKADRHDASIPLTVFGGVMLLAAATEAALHTFSSLILAGVALAFWIPGFFAALAITWWAYRRQAMKTGIAPKGRVYLLAGIWVPIAALAVIGPVALLLWFIPLMFFPLHTIAVTLLIIGLVQRSKILSIAALLFGGAVTVLVKVFEVGGPMFTLMDWLTPVQIGVEYSYKDPHHFEVYAGLGVLLAIMAIIARKLESRHG